MAMSIPGAVAVTEEVHGLPKGFINDVGPEAAAQVAVWLWTGKAHVTPTGKIAWGPKP